jgi:hypothetical protein
MDTDDLLKSRTAVNLGVFKHIHGYVLKSGKINEKVHPRKPGKTYENKRRDHPSGIAEPVGNQFPGNMEYIGKELVENAQDRIVDKSPDHYSNYRRDNHGNNKQNPVDILGPAAFKIEYEFSPNKGCNHYNQHGPEAPIQNVPEGYEKDPVVEQGDIIPYPYKYRGIKPVPLGKRTDNSPQSRIITEPKQNDHHRGQKNQSCKNLIPVIPS